jgi:hypothetical protein
MDKNSEDADNEKSTSDMIHEIKIGSLDPCLLDKLQRQLCVEALYFDAVSTSGIAQFLKVSDRTIRRDMEEIRARNSLTPSLDLSREIVGEFLLWSRAHRGNLMKLARNSSASTGERAQAEYYASMVGADMIVKLQSLGYLPKSADALVVTQQSEDSVSDERMSQLLGELDDMSDLSDSPEQADKLIELKKNIEEKK